MNEVTKQSIRMHIKELQVESNNLRKSIAETEKDLDQWRGELAACERQIEELASDLGEPVNDAAAAAFKTAVEIGKDAA